ncbi:MAG: hypothetical protein ACPG61_07275 [Paracoccaceae bacterium]
MAVLFARAGRVSRGNADITPLTFCEIEAFARIEGGVDRMDMQTLRDMSVAFVDWLHHGKDVFALPPWDGD